MLSSIHPLGERSRHNRYGLTASAFIVGATLGGIVLGSSSAVAGAVAGLAVPLSEANALAAGIAVALVGAVGDAVRGGRPLPRPQRQVNEDWLTTYRGWVYGVGFGFQLGIGVVTYITTLGVASTIGIAFLTGRPVVGAVIGAAFGLSRGLTVLGVAHVRDPTSLRRFHERMAASVGSMRRLTVVAQAVVTLVVLATVVL